MSFEDQKTSFGELSVAEQTPHVQVMFAYNINADLATTTVADGGTAAAAGGLLVLSTGTDAAGVATIDSVNVLRYGAGQGGIVRFTTVFTEGVADSQQIAGLGDDVDGFFVGYNGTSFGVMRRSGGVDDWIAIEDWNRSVPVPSPENRRGYSLRYNVPIELDFTKGQVWQIRYQWLGFGEIEFSVENPNTGSFEIVHRIQYANSAVVPSILNPTLPMHMSVKNTGNTSSLVLKSSSMYAAIDGKEPDLFTRNSVSAEAASSATEAVFLTIRNRATYVSITNRVRALLDMLILTVDTGNLQKFRVLRNASLTGASFSDVSTNTSIMEVDTSASAFSGGTELMSIPMPGAMVFSLDIASLDLSLNPGDSISVTVDLLQGAAADVGCSMSWRELF